MRIAIIVGIGLIVANLAFVDYRLISGSGTDLLIRRQVEKSDDETSGFNVIQVEDSTASASLSPTPQLVDSCYPRSCIDLIREATASIGQKTVEKQTIVSQKSSGGEFYVTLGSGQTKSDEWVDMIGLTAYIDNSKYGKIKKVTFEASMYIQNDHGRVYAQLYNETDKHPVWFSEISMEGDKPKLLVSDPISLDSGNKLYKVQMKTSLKEVSIIDQARVHIITE